MEALESSTFRHWPGKDRMKNTHPPFKSHRQQVTHWWYKTFHWQELVEWCHQHVMRSLGNTVTTEQPLSSLSFTVNKREKQCRGAVYPRLAYCLFPCPFHCITVHHWKALASDHVMGTGGGADDTGAGQSSWSSRIYDKWNFLIYVLLMDTLKSQYHLLSSLPDIYLCSLLKFIFLRSVTKDYSAARVFI